MKINGNDIFMGAYAERHQKTYQFNQQGLQVSAQKADAIQKGIKEAMGLVKLQKLGVSVSISKEDRDFLCSEEGF